VPSKRTVKKVKREPGHKILKGLKEAVAHARGGIELQSRYYAVTPPVDVKAIRQKLKLSQSEFAARFKLNVRTVQDWESSGAQPRSAVRNYLIVIENDPEAVVRALAGRVA
jgi:putative transcriptional regulator